MSTPYFNARHGTAPVVVQGTIVVDHSATTATSTTRSALISGSDFSQALNAGEWTKGEPQPRKCQDLFWAILFYIHLGLVGFATIQNAPLMAQDLAQDYSSGAQRRFLEEDGGDVSIDTGAVLLILAFSGLAGFVLSSLAMLVMMNFAEGLIKLSLVFNLVIAAIMVVVSLLGHVIGMAIMFGIGFLFSAYYCYIVWNKIPFAAANLITATTAVRANIGLAFFAYTNLFTTFFWSLWWAIAFIATSYVLGECDAEGNCQQEIKGGLVFLFLVSYFWTAQVIKNVVHTTVAGTVGTFWFAPLEANGCCSRGVRDSYCRSITTSFGSICLGSLIVAIIQAIKEIVHSMREHNDSLLACLADCILGCLESLAEYFNQWAFVYVGLYGYSFVEAGKNVMSLFRSRGWTSIVADMLVDTVLLMVSLGVGVLTGVVGVIVGSFVQNDSWTLVACFFIGMVIGFVLCSTLFSLISSAVNATIVLYAEAPAEFQANHPQLSDQMRSAWRKAYPTEFQY